MSEENVNLARQGVAALNETYRTGDISPWRRWVEGLFDPDVVVEAGTVTFTEGVWRGHDGAVGFVANQMDVLEGMWTRADEFIDVDDDCLVVGISFGGRARHTGIDVELTAFHIFRLRNGKQHLWRDTAWAMSEENVEVVLKMMDAVNRRDRDAFMACLHPDVEWREESGDPLPGLRGIYRGRAEVRAWFEEAVVELWESFDIEVEEITEASDHRVFIGIRGSARGKASGVETELRSWQVFTFVDGKAASREIFLNRDEALEAAGLSE